MPKNIKLVETDILEESQQEATIDSFLKLDNHSDTTKKDKKITLRINSQVYEQFTKINQKLGSPNSVMLNMFIVDHINKNKDLL